MIRCEPVKQDAYLRQWAYDSLTRHGITPGVDDVLSHNKPTFDITSPKTYKATEGIRIYIDLKDKQNIKDLIALYEKFYGKKPGYLHPEMIINSVIGDADRYLYFKDDDACSFNPKDLNHWDTEFTCTVYTLDKFEELPLTKREQEKLAEAEKAKTKASFHAMVAKDIMVTELNKLGYDIVVYDNRYLNYGKVKGWNKLVKDAFEYYINNVVLKDVGCKINLPKVKNQHKYNFDDFLCDLGYVELDLK